MIRSLLLALLLTSLSACGSAKAGGSAIAHQLTSPLPGYTCFEIDNAAGDAVGGNCVKD